MPFGCFMLAFCSARGTCVSQVCPSSSTCGPRIHEAEKPQDVGAALHGRGSDFSGCILLGNSRPTRSAVQPVRGRRHNCIAERVVATADALAAALSIELDLLK